MKSFFKDSPELEPGGFFDLESYVGIVRIMLLLGFMPIYSIRYIDLWMQLLWPLFSSETLDTPKWKMQLHAYGGWAIGMVTLIMQGIALFMLLRHRRRYDLPDDKLMAQVSPVEQSLRKTIRRWPFLHDVVWGWPLLLALPLLVLGHNRDGSPASSLIEIFDPPSLGFFYVGRAPVSALNAIFFGALAYGANHALSKTPRLPFFLKLVLNACFGALAIVAWYTLTSAMGAPAWGAKKHMVSADIHQWAQIWGVLIKGAGIISIPFMIRLVILAVVWRHKEKKALKAEEDPKVSTEKPLSEVKPPLYEKPIWNDEPQETAGIRPLPGTRSTCQFGNARLEMKDGKTLLIVPRKEEACE